MNVYEYHIKGIEYIKFIITNIIVNIFYESNDILKSKVTSDEKYHKNGLTFRILLYSIDDLVGVRVPTWDGAVSAGPQTICDFQ